MGRDNPPLPFGSVPYATCKYFWVPLQDRETILKTDYYDGLSDREDCKDIISKTPGVFPCLLVRVESNVTFLKVGRHLDIVTITLILIIFIIIIYLFSGYPGPLDQMSLCYNVQFPGLSPPKLGLIKLVPRCMLAILYFGDMPEDQL